MNELQRANKLTISTDEFGHFVGTFYRTHKELKKIVDSETGYQPSLNANINLQREMYRVYLMDNADKFGINWDPTDRRTEENVMPKRYDTDALLIGYAKTLLHRDLLEFCSKANSKMEHHDLEYKDLTTEDLQEVTEYNGRKVSAKYSNGCWAYAKVTLVATFSIGDKEAYLTTEMLLVSGQLKKPTKIGTNGFHYTGFITELAVDLPELKDLMTTKKEAEVKVAK